MTGKLYLSGGGTENFLWRHIFKDVKSIVYIPLAWPNDDFQSCLKWFKSLNTKISQLNIDMLTNPKKQSFNLSKYDLIFIGGGNTFKLLKKLKDSKFDKELIKFYKNGGKIYGGSAGAIIWGANIEIAFICKDKDKNLVNLKDTFGFNIIKNHDIQCHFEDDQIKEHQEYITKTNRNIIAIPEGSALLVEKGEFKVIGFKPITLITKKTSQRFSQNSTIPILK